MERAVQAMDRAAPRLIALLASEGEEVGRKALNVLLRRPHPPAAVAYLGEALGRPGGDTRLRRRVASALAAIGQQVREPATTTLIACLLNERDEGFAGHLLACLSDLGPAPGGPC
jgi:hypothetical protein